MRFMRLVMEVTKIMMIVIMTNDNDGYDGDDVMLDDDNM